MNWRLMSVVLLWAEIGCRSAPDKSIAALGDLPAEAGVDGDGDGVVGDDDCDDTNATVGAGLPEVCDGLDNDCDGMVDEEVTQLWYVDADADGFGDPTTPESRCEPGPGMSSTGGDCDDADASVFPGAPELCDGYDQDCDGVPDNGVQTTYWTDADRDGYGDVEQPIEACEIGDGWVDNAEDCDDDDDSVHPLGVEVCNEQDDDCDGVVDEDVTSLWFLDLDGDGYGQVGGTTEACARPTGYAASAGDCDDALSTVFPGAVEVCNDVDDNCDGVVDEADAVDAPTWFGDRDSDGFGDPAVSVAACAQPPGFVAQNTDCDDGDAAVSPIAAELCNSKDDDCDSVVDESDAVDAPTWYADLDGDGFGWAAAPTRSCTQPSSSVSNASDCDDTASAVFPGASERCNGVDDDCDSTVDEADAVDATRWYTDSDRDGYGDPLTGAAACSAPAGTVADNTDCDDTQSSVNPGESEVCNGVDDDCDGRTDDDDPGVDATTGSVFYADIDGDGFGDASHPVWACARPSGHVSGDTDCDDGDGSAFPGAPEPCNSIDDLNCDGFAADTCLSCLDALEDGASTGDGIYTIDPDGAGGHSPLDVWCDMRTDGGGWTLVQRTVWSWSESSQLDTSLSQWRGTTYGDPAPGYAFRLAGELWPTLQVEQEHLLVHVARDLSGSDCAPLYYIGTGGAYTVSSTSTTITSISSTATFINSATLSTNNSGPSSYCVNSYDGVPWFYSSCCTTCPTFKGGYWSDTAHPMASYLDVTADEYGNIAANVCSTGAAVSSYGYEGVNDMAYFLR